MLRIAVVVALLAACRGDRLRSKHQDADRHGSASAVSVSPDSVVPKLPKTEDGVAELQALDERIRKHAASRATLIPLLLERAAIRGRVDDYMRARAESATFVEQAPNDAHAWQLRVQVLLRVHDFTAAKAALANLAKLVDPSHLVEHEIALADAADDSERALELRQQLADEFRTAQRLTVVAASLAHAGRFDEAVALVPKAAAAVRDNPPHLIAWLLFQWGRIYELKGETATAREFFVAAHARMPGYVEATAHLAQTMIATNHRAAAMQLVDRALADDRHPELLAIAVQLGRGDVLGEARATWERYVAALPLAFADHAARFYLGVGRDPKRALELARMNLRNRDTTESRALAIEAALATGEPSTACVLVEPLLTAGTRRQRFVAWQAVTRCGRTDDAERLARALGISP
jgi:tetratricopeptide (TPR) repeat protein